MHLSFALLFPDFSQEELKALCGSPSYITGEVSQRTYEIIEGSRWEVPDIISESF